MSDVTPSTPQAVNLTPPEPDSPYDNVVLLMQSHADGTYSYRSVEDEDGGVWSANIQPNQAPSEIVLSYEPAHKIDYNDPDIVGSSTDHSDNPTTSPTSTSLNDLDDPADDDTSATFQGHAGDVVGNEGYLDGDGPQLPAGVRDSNNEDDNLGMTTDYAIDQNGAIRDDESSFVSTDPDLDWRDNGI